MQEPGPKEVKTITSHFACADFVGYQAAHRSLSQQMTNIGVNVETPSRACNKS